MRTFTLVLALMLSGLLLQAQTGSPCPGEPTVTYDGKTYNTILVGDRCWLKENLNVGTMILSGQDQKNNGIIEKYCYGDLPANCETYGGFYQWQEAMQYDITPGAQGICPPGWRIPTDDEWKMLEGAADSQFNYGDAEWDNMNFRGFDAGKNLKALNGWLYNGNGTDNLGIAILPGGHRDFCGTYYSDGHSNYLWTSTEQSDKTAWYRILSSNSMQVSRRYAHKNMGVSVRCLRDYTPPPTYTLNLEVNPADAGTVTGAGQYLAGQQVSISALANTGWEFVNWTDNNGIVSETPDFTYTMPAEDITLIANFAEEQVGFTCGQPLTDPRDGIVYNTIRVGSQCWMQENLKYLPAVVGPGTASGTDPYYYVYGYDGTDVSAAKLTANYQTYGALYNGPAAITACPTGWHLPSDNEWTALTTYVSSKPEFHCNSNPDWIAKSLAATTLWQTQTFTCAVGNNLSANNTTGFTGIPGGSRVSTGGGAFSSLLFSSNYYSSTAGTTPFGQPAQYIRQMTSSSPVVTINLFPKDDGLSVRCVWDLVPQTFQLNLNINPVGAGVVFGAGQYQPGDEINISAQANPGWEFVNWTDDDGIVSEAAVFTYTMPASEVTFTANFVELPPANLYLEVNPAGAGTVTGAGLYEAGQQVNISALANPGWEFVNWTDNGVIVSELAVFTYTMPAEDVTLTANFVEEQVGFTCGTSTVTDIDGYVYNTLLIGDQCWMDKNLSTTRFRDGSTIAQAWVYPHASVPGIDSDEQMVAAYGRLYSWHAANDAKGICPEGWTIPAQSEFQQLVDYVIATYEEVTAANPAYAFKSCRQVNSPLGGDCNTTTHPRWDQTTNHGFDIVDFSALPAGRIMSGAFSGIGSQLYFWSSTEHNAANGVFARIMNGFDVVTITNMDKNRGVSLRCIKE